MESSSAPDAHSRGLCSAPWRSKMIIATLSHALSQAERLSLPIWAAVFVVLFVLETVRPLRSYKRKRAGRVATNMIMWAQAFAAGALVRLVGLALAQWVTTSRIGLVHVLRLPGAAAMVGGFLLMDLSFYYWHRLNHSLSLLWRLHNVHHIDPDLDLSTSFRFHAVEILLSTGFRALQVVVIGVAPVLYVTYGLVFQSATMFHHSNLRLPIGLERLINLAVVTPRMHGIHHSTVRAETDSNYSVIFRWWDKLHKTLRLNVPQAEIDIGISAYQKPKDNRLDRLLVGPFLRQRSYCDGEPARAAAPGSRSDLLME